MTTFSHTTLTEIEREKYSRQLRIEGFGEAGQLRLKNATALVSRVGGVGGTAAMNLVRAGIGRVILAHHGDIVPEYLNRWQLINEDDVGKPVVGTWAKKLRAINPSLEIVEFPHYLNDNNVRDLVAMSDVVVDGAPLFEERYAMNKAAFELGKPLCMGAMYSTEGYASTFIPGKTPCLACVYPTAPEYWTNIKVFPAIGPGPVMVGTTIAMEAIKVISGFGQPLLNKLWFFDIESNAVRHFNIHRNVDCKVCGHLHH
jgi:molybdopterin/thiamine biosynthesis adenylyltransferase